jgi:hypothetical protein
VKIRERKEIRGKRKNIEKNKWRSRKIMKYKGRERKKEED